MARRVLFAVSLGAFLAGCASLTPHPLAPNATAELALLGSARGLPLRDPLEVPPALRALIRQRVGLEGNEDERVRRLKHWLHDSAEGFVYAAGESASAGEAWRQNRGDCFAVTNLFIAAARELHIDARYVYVREVGRYQERDGSFVVSSHVAAVVGAGPEPQIVDFERAPDERTLADFRPLDDGAAFALFNNNLAVQQLLHGRPHVAEAMLRFLIEQSPELPELRNNLGVALNREGRSGLARDALSEALARFPDYAPLYTNAVAAAHALGDEEGAHALELRGITIAGDDALFLFGQGLRRYELRDFRGAAERFERAVDLQDDSTIAWAWLARARLKQGHLEEGRRAFARARSLAPDDPRLRALLRQAPQLGPE